MSSIADNIILAEKELIITDQKREEILKLTRNLIRGCSKAITDLHRGQEAEGMAVQGMVDRLVGFRSGSPELYYQGFVTQALQEYVEYAVFEKVLNGDPVPTHEDLGVEPDAYILGIADVAGELRRRCLDQVNEGKIEEARKIYAMMQEIFDSLRPIHLPNKVLPLKRKKDVLRSLVERTQSDLMGVK